MAATTPIPELPEPPLRTDGRSDFTIKADALMAALPPMVVNINTRLTWIDQQVTAADGFRQAAATSATNAASSATAANTSKNAAATSATQATTNGAAQVTLAAAQVTLAQQARDSAQVAAAAAQAAAGLPSLVGNAYKVLRVNAGATGVEWGLGLPVMPGVGGAPGKVLNIAANGTSLAWAEFYKVGDIITTARNPGSLWLPADGSIRAQSSYPVLFAALGLIGNTLGAVWQTTTNPLTAPTDVASGANGTTISVTSAGLVSRSTNRGQTWSAAVDIGLANASKIGTDGKGTWIITSATLTGSGKRSLDDGLSWENISLPGTSAGSWVKPTYCGGTTWIAVSNTNSNNIAISNNNGSTWTTFVTGLGSVTITDIASDEAGVVIFNTGANMRRSQDFGATFATVTLPGTPALAALGTDKLGNWIASGNLSSSTYVSVNNGLGFALSSAIGPSVQPVKILNSDSGLILVTQTATQYVYKNGSASTFAAPNNLNAQTSSPGGNYLITAAGAQRALPFIYDTTSQFQLPAMPVVSGVKSYIKALEAAA